MGVKEVKIKNGLLIGDYILIFVFVLCFMYKFINKLIENVNFKLAYIYEL